MVRLRLDEAALESDESGVPALEISCEATYTREGEKSAYAYECFKYDARYQSFMRKKQFLDSKASMAPA